MMKVRTGGEDVGFIVWDVDVPWKARRELLQTKAIELNTIGSGGAFVVDTTKVREALWPECIRGWSGDGTGEGTCPTEEEFWGAPMVHLERLATQVAEWLITGVEPSTASHRGDAENAENNNGHIGRTAEAGGEMRAAANGEADDDVIPLRSG